jgi:glycosyltransferase involved in cell wall biosynthesis
VLEARDIISADEIVLRAQPPYKLVTVATLEQPYKGIDTLLEAVSLCLHRGHQVELEIVGEGRMRQGYEKMASELGLANRVTFPGHLAKPEVFRALDRSDLFVLPTRQEGLPRVLIEAMARGKPAIASWVGGIPELLDNQYLFPPNDPYALAAAIGKVISDPDSWRGMAYSNTKRAQDFLFPLVWKRRVELYNALYSATLLP